MTPIVDPDFDTWIRLCFDPPAGDEPWNDWYWDIDLDGPQLTPPVAADHILRLLEAPGQLLEMHHDNQVASGLKFVFDTGCGGDSILLEDPRVSQAQRLEVAARIDRLYSEVFVPRCPEVLGFRSEEGGRLAMLAYMFWDTSSLGNPPVERDRAEYHGALLDAMERILALPHATAQEGALHGLGHWRQVDPARTEAIIDRYLSEGRAARPELVGYARAARSGCVL